MATAQPIAVPLSRQARETGRGTFELGAPARGPWRSDAAHGGAPAALLTRAIEAEASGSGMRLASFQSVFLGPVMLGPVELESEVIKPGKRQRVVAARLVSEGRTLIEARGVLLRTGRIDLPTGVGQVDRERITAMAPPEDFRRN